MYSCTPRLPSLKTKFQSRLSSWKCPPSPPFEKEVSGCLFLNSLYLFFLSLFSTVPDEYFCNLDHTGRRVDLVERPELSFGSVEFVATAQYCKVCCLNQFPTSLRNLLKQTPSCSHCKKFDTVFFLQISLIVSSCVLSFPLQAERLPDPPAFIFLIDVTYPSIQSGLVSLLSRMLPHVLSNLPT